MNLAHSITALRVTGVRQAAWRLYFEAARKSGWFRHRYSSRDLAVWKIPNVDAIVDRLQTGERFFIPSNTDPSALFYRGRFSESASSIINEADRIRHGEMPYFSKMWHQFESLPDWFLNPFTGEVVDQDQHWSQLAFFSPQYGDLKFMLEPARFGFAYKLVRGYWMSGNEEYPAVFWDILENWLDKNPPQSGPLWICGQESALRVMSWCFALYGFGRSSHTTPDRVAKLIALIAAHGDRIEGVIAYARSQKNNHALSEAMGLWTIGVLFPELKQANRWRERGRRILEDEVRQQIYADGSYIQHSVNYHRLMLHILLWVCRLDAVNGESLSKEVHQKFGLATQFLFHILNPETGETPNYGSNDGALALPLNTCDYRDFRPVLQAAHHLLHGKPFFSNGPWDEDLYWLFGAAAVADPEPQASQISNSTVVEGTVAHCPSASYPVGGYYTLRGRHSWCFTRCAHYKDRPGQADQLHVDLWWRNINIACDAGTYLYNSRPPWDNALAATTVHNTVTVDDQDQMTRAGRFLWLDWAQGTVRARTQSEDRQIEYWEGEHDGYRRLPLPVRHQRAILRIGEECWLILDSLTSLGEHRYRLHWLLPDMPRQWDVKSGQLALTTPAGPYYLQMKASTGQSDYSLVRADEATPRGWRAPYYGCREPALSLAATQQAACLNFWTLFGPEQCQVIASEAELSIQAAEWQAIVQHGVHPQEPLVTSMIVQGEVQGNLKVTV